MDSLKFKPILSFNFPQKMFLIRIFLKSKRSMLVFLVKKQIPLVCNLVRQQKQLLFINYKIINTGIFKKIKIYKLILTTMNRIRMLAGLKIIIFLRRH